MLENTKCHKIWRFLTLIQPTPRAFAILAVAEANGLELDLVYAEKEYEENYAKLLEYNPLGQVPVFVGADGLVLTECVAIALYSMLYLTAIR